MNNPHTCLPGKILSWNGETANVIPTLSKKLANGEQLNAPQIINVPVCFPVGMGGAAQVSVPLQSGDDVLLIFCERSLENWINGDNSAPDDPRRYDLTDCFAIPMVRPTKTKVDTDNVSLVYNSASFKISKEGDISINCRNYNFQAESATVDSQNFTHTGGNLAIQTDSVSHNGKNIGSGHTHSGVEKGNKNTGSVV